MTLHSATSVAELWRATLQDVVQRAAHEVKDALNGVSLNLEVLRSRTQDSGVGDAASLAAFAVAATEQLELLTARTEALLALSRPAKSGPCDVALTLRQLATLLVPAARADGGGIELEMAGNSAPTSASVESARLVLAAGLLGIIDSNRQGAESGSVDHRVSAGWGRCKLDGEGETVVRFSHESAAACSLDPAIVAAITSERIRHQMNGPDLVLVFPRYQVAI